VLVSVLAFLGIAIGALALRDRSTGGNSSDFVVSAAAATLTQRTADVLITGTVTAAGRTVPMTGTGQARLSSPQAFATTIAVSAGGGSFEEKEVLADGQLYFSIGSAGQDVSAVVPGKHWVAIPIPMGTGGSLGTGTSDPLAQLQMLGAKGNRVASLGTKEIRGAAASGYAVTLSRQNQLNAEQQYLASSGLDAATQHQMSQAAKRLAPPTIDVWFDSSKLLRRMGFVISQTQNGKTVSTDLNMDFVNYGAPVAITPPSPGDVVPLSQFLAAAKAASTSATAGSS
jgi:hypothetical protein